MQLFFQIGKPRRPDRRHILRQIRRCVSLHKRSRIIPVALDHSGQKQPGQQSDHEKIFVIIDVFPLQLFQNRIDLPHCGRKEPFYFLLGNSL